MIDKNKPYSIPNIKKYYANAMGIKDYQKIADGRYSSIFNQACKNLNMKLEFSYSKNKLKFYMITQNQWESILSEIEKLSKTERKFKKAHTEMMIHGSRGRGFYAMYNYFFDNVRDYENKIRRKQALIDIIISKNYSNEPRYIINRIFKNKFLLARFLCRLSGSVFKQYNSRRNQSMGSLLSVKKNIKMMCYRDHTIKQMNFKHTIFTESQLRAILELMKIYKSNKGGEYLDICIMQLELFFNDIEAHCNKYDTLYKENHIYRSLWL